MGFHADLFGQKTKFFFLWEDVEDIQRIPPTLSSMGSPVISMILQSGRGNDARHGAKSLDAKGRLGFHFHSFVSFNVAHRYHVPLYVYAYRSQFMWFLLLVAIFILVMWFSAVTLSLLVYFQSLLNNLLHFPPLFYSLYHSWLNSICYGFTFNSHST